VAAILTALDMATEGRQAAVLDGRHHLELAEAHMPGRWLGARRPPWRWKTSATSSRGRRIAAGLRSGSRPRLGQWREPAVRSP